MFNPTKLALKVDENSSIGAQSYCGRGMASSFSRDKDRYCVALTGPSTFKIIAELIRNCDPEDLSELAEMIESGKQDNLGHDVVLYFPNEKWDEDADQEWRDELYGEDEASESEEDENEEV
jgi:hypothetical protein